MPRYAITITGETLEDLIGALVETTALVEFGAANRTMTAELVDLAEPANGHAEGPLPTPPPDYEATGLTQWQAVQARTAPPGSGVAVAPAPREVQTAAPATPFCPIHNREMVWKGGGLSKNGKNLPLWSCPDTNCRQAIWPQR